MTHSTTHECADLDRRATGVATGFELSLAVEAAKTPANDGVAVRVVSMPCAEWFEAEDEEYRDSVLPRRTSARVVVEAAATLNWWRYAGDRGRVIGVDRFGESGSAAAVFDELNVSVERVLAEARSAPAEGSQTDIPVEA